MKKNLMFFVFGVSTTLLIGAGMSYWNQINQANKYGIEVNPSFFDPNIPRENKYGIEVNPSIFDPNIPRENRYALIVDGNVSQNAKNVMVAGFIYGMAVGRKKAKEEDQEKSSTSNGAWGFP